MRWLIDECVDRQIAERLKQDGQDVVCVSDFGPGISDDQVLALAADPDVILLTADKGFGEMVFRRRLSTGGVVLTRLSGLDPVDKAAIVSALVRKHRERLFGSFVVIDPRGVRIRRVPPL